MIYEEVDVFCCDEIIFTMIELEKIPLTKKEVA
jgi:hypothetical protein